MKTNYPILLITLALLLPAKTHAQNQTDPVTAAITISKSEVYECETFYLTLTITTTGIQIRPKMDIKNLPDPQNVAIINKFESLPVKRTGNGHSIVEIHRYRCRARSLTPGTTEIAPTLHLTALQRKRALIGSFWEERQLKLQIPATTLTTKALPDPPNDFSGAIGLIKFNASIYPKDVAPGDLITLTTKISGVGYTENIHNFMLAGSKHLKTYQPEQISDDKDLLTFDQVVIPQSTNITTIPKIGLTYFDTNSGKYRRITQGPFPLTFHEIQTVSLEHFKPEVDKTKTTEPKQKPKIGFIAKLMQTMGHARYKHATCHTETDAHLAPSKTSPATFKIPANSAINIIAHHNNWLKAEHNKKRGWIPTDAIQ